MPGPRPFRLPRWYLAASVGFLTGLIGVSAAWQPSERVALATGIAGAVVSLALVELVLLWQPRRDG
jgi:hypothetical protein